MRPHLTPAPQDLPIPLAPSARASQRNLPLVAGRGWLRPRPQPTLPGDISVSSSPAAPVTPAVLITHSAVHPPAPAGRPPPRTPPTFPSLHLTALPSLPGARGLRVEPGLEVGVVPRVLGGPPAPGCSLCCPLKEQDQSWRQEIGVRQSPGPAGPGSGWGPILALGLDLLLRG